MDGNGKNNELINHIAERLRNHTEPYREGAWERFSAQTGGRGKRTIGWLGWAAAVVLLVGAGWLIFNRPQEELNIAQQLPEPPPVAIEEQPATEEGSTEEQIAASPRQVAASPGINNRIAHNTLPPTDSETVARTAMVSKPSRTVISDLTDRETAQAATDTTWLASVAETPGKPDDAAAEEQDTANVQEDRGISRPSLEQLIAQESAQPGQKAYDDNAMEKAVTEEIGKWDLGIAVAPSMTSERLNIGGGLAVAYRLSDKFSLASGISLSDLGVAEQQAGRSPMPQASLSPNSPAPDHGPGNSAYRYREITSVTSALLAIDIPLNLRYHVTKGFYTSVGVSFLGILNERRTNHFVDHINQPTDYGNNLTAVHSTARSDEQPLQGKGYTGFFNFSVGRSIPLSKKLFISVEPYFKLPIGRLSQEDMDLTNGGIRIVTGF